MQTVEDLMAAAIGQRPVDFEHAFNSLMIDKARDAIKHHKVEMAKSLFATAIREGRENSPSDWESPSKGAGGGASAFGPKTLETPNSGMGTGAGTGVDPGAELPRQFVPSERNAMVRQSESGKKEGGKKKKDIKEANWIAGAIKHPGAEKKAAKKAGMSTHSYMEKHKHDSGKSGSRARLGLTLSKMHHKE